MTGLELIGKMSQPGGFLRIQLRDIVLFLALSAFIITQWLVKNDKIDRLTGQVAQLVEAQRSDHAKITEMDVRGTQYSLSRTNLEDERMLEMGKRITSLENVISPMPADIREIKADIGFITKYLEESKKK